jgi:hypothetical protein
MTCEGTDEIDASGPATAILDLWVLEGSLDLPIYFSRQNPDDKNVVRGMFIDFSGQSGDGVIEFRAEDAARINQSVWWSRDEPVRFDFRASVRAGSMIDAWLRSVDFLEQALDRLTVLAGEPAQILQAGLLYNESQLEECRVAKCSEFECTTHGVQTRKTSPFSNIHVIDRLQPSDRAKRALRWFRKGLLNENIEDRFLAFYFTLECISNDVKETVEKHHICQSCGKSTGISKAQTDGIKALIARYPEAPKSLFSKIGKVRASLVHGGDPADRERVRQLEPIVRTLAADGIALSLGIDPVSVRVTDTSRMDIIPIMRGVYDPKLDPANKWGRSMTAFLSELHARAVSNG